MQRLSSSICFFVALFTLLLALFFVLFVQIAMPESGAQAIRLNQLFGFAAFGYLYITLFASPLIHIWPTFPLRRLYIRARRALGIGAFFFASLHGLLTFFQQLNGFSGLAFLSNEYLFAISLGAIALFILFILTLTSFDRIKHKLGFKTWKCIHRFVYLAGFATLIHIFLLGTHFSDLSETFPRLTLLAILFLLLLEAQRFDTYLKQRIGFWRKAQWASLFTACVSGAAVLWAFFPQTAQTSLNIHAVHIQLAKEAQQTANITPFLNINYPGLVGDRTKRFTVSFIHSNTVSANTDTPLNFQVFDAASGNPVQLFTPIYTKVLHLIIVDDQLQIFQHIHPTLTDTGFQITTRFPKNGTYHLYLNFQPIGAIEQQFAFTLQVGPSQTVTSAIPAADFSPTKTFGQYEVTMQYPTPLVTTQLAVGEQKITFHIVGATTHAPIITLQPYLAAFGHLTMINQQTFEYLHVHPTNLFPPKPTDTAGPDVEFLPLGLYGPIKPGIYRVFAEFQINSQVITTDFAVKVE